AGKPGSLSIAWDDWKDTGAALKIRVLSGFQAWRCERLERTGMEMAEGIEVFDRALGSGFSRIAVSTHDLGERSKELATLMHSLDRFAHPAGRRPRPNLDVTLVPPSTDAESVLVRIWQEVLGLETVGVRDSFLDLGGHSLLAVQVITRAR